MPDEREGRFETPDPGMPSSSRPGHRRRWVMAGVVVVLGGGWAAVGARGSADSSARVPQFVDETTSSGLVHRYDGDFPFFVGGGVAVLDCDDDGFPDLYVGGGSQPAALFRNVSQVGGALRFEQIESPVTDIGSTTGAYPLDVDSDGHLDLVVLRNGERNLVLAGLGGCRFEDATERLGLPAGDEWTVGFSATWEGTNRLPTLAFGHYLVPDTFDCDINQLVRPAAGGDRYDVPLPLAPAHCTLSLLFSDWSRSGRADLRVANDRHYYREGSEQLWSIAGSVPQLYAEADGWRPLQLWGMGLASQDLTGDGRPEVFITSQADNKLQTLDATTDRPTYRDIALERGVTAQRPFVGDDILPSTAWHPEFDDVNNDGLVDLFVSKGNVEAQIESAALDPSNLLIQQPDGAFEEGAEAAGVLNFDRARGAAVTDLNLDGLLDLVVVNRTVNVEVWRNVGQGDAGVPEAMGHWIAVRLEQPAPNVDAIGAWLSIRADGRLIERELTVGGGHAGGELGWVHAGLGAAEQVEVRVQWPDGDVGPWMTVDADQFVTIERGAAAPSAMTPPPAE